MKLYDAFQAWTDMMMPMRSAAGAALTGGGWIDNPLTQSWRASLEMVSETRVTHERPPFAIASALSGNREYAVREEITLSRPFGNLLHFVKEDAPPLPKMLVVAPLSGHFATLLRGTVETLLRDHDVYITDWINPREVPLSDGKFGFDDYIAYLIAFLEELGPGANILAVCQPCVQTLAAVAVMAKRKSACQPRTMTLMGGPVDPRVSPTAVNEFAMAKSPEWFQENLISKVPARYKGAGRDVYPGFLQLTAFLSMNMGRHMAQHRALYQHLANGEHAEAKRIKDFYDEYFAVIDLAADFYLETVDRVFQRALLAKGELMYEGERVDCGAIRKTALLTVEGERDDICSVGQTAAAHDLCSSLRPHLKRHHLQPGVGHYGVFSGSKWERQVYPQVKSLVLAMA